jgi:hypothetical protein
MVLAPSCRLMFASTISLDHLKMPDGKRGRDPLNSGWGARIPLLVGRASAEDTFIFNDNTNFAGSLNGGNGIDTLDYSACTIPATINLQTFTTTGITGNFTAIEAVLGSSGNDTLIGSDKGAVFTMISSGHGSVTVPGITGGVFTFTALENIQGGTGMDTLSFADYQEAVTVNLEDGIITGLAGIGGIEKIVGSMAITDRIIGRSSGSSFKITGLDSGTIDEISFESFEFLSGGNGNDSFAFSGKASLSGSIDGGAGNDTLDYSNYSSAVIFNLLTSSSTGLTGFSNINILVGSKSADTIIGSDADTLFIIDGSNSGSVNGIIFSSIENLQGGQGNDTFSFVGQGKVDGKIAGQGGNNTLDYSGYAEAVILNLQTLTGSGLAGFEGIQIVIGSSNHDTIKGSNKGDNYLITGQDQGIINDTLSFISIENLIGGSANDRFAFSAASGLSGDLQGGDGTDTLDYSNFGSGVVVNLSTGEASNVDGKISQFENITGSAFDDTLSGDGKANTINGLAGNDILNGGGGNDIYIFHSDWGHDTIIESFNGGSDTVDFSNITSDLIFTLGNDYTISDGANSVIHLGGEIEQLLGGSGNDRFCLTGSASVKGRIDGGAGSNTLDYSGYDTARSISLTGLGSINGFAGKESSLAYFDNISNIVGSNSDTDVLSGLNDNSVYSISGMAAGSYSSGGQSLSFASIEGLAGGSGDDRLDFGSIDEALSVLLSGVTNNGFSGSVEGIIAGFTGMNEILGTAQADSFTGLNNSAVFHLSDTITYRYNNMALKLGSFEVLRGGSGNDSFVFDNNAVYTGHIDGQGGKDTLDYSQYQTAVTLKLTALGSIDGFDGVTV